MPDRREIYRSPNGDLCVLGREPENGHAFIIYRPNAPSGGRSHPTSSWASSCPAEMGRNNKHCSV